MLVALESLDSEAELIAIFGGGVPRRLPCRSEEASAEDGWPARASAPALELGDCTFMQQRAASNRATYKRCQTAKHSQTSPHSVRFIDIDQ